ncbi:hypothetical protein EVAR_97746_1 [Eumeta japonica]|uniref:Uncharacterized protein n=1 Tax=Eumeta variegata TaxID=151549 RepID=A0A4C1XA47_EUMVA|nr:hypothetical protein EVAR_97746_1 [Eumeta japonica]
MYLITLEDAVCSLSINHSGLSADKNTPVTKAPPQELYRRVIVRSRRREWRSTRYRQRLKACKNADTQLSLILRLRSNHSPTEEVEAVENAGSIAPDARIIDAIKTKLILRALHSRRQPCGSLRHFRRRPLALQRWKPSLFVAAEAISCCEAVLDGRGDACTVGRRIPRQDSNIFPVKGKRFGASPPFTLTQCGSRPATTAVTDELATPVTDVTTCCRGQDSNPGPSHYKPTMSSTRPLLL